MMSNFIDLTQVRSHHQREYPRLLLILELFKELVVFPSIQQMKLHYETLTFLPSHCLECHFQLGFGHLNQPSPPAPRFCILNIFPET